MNDALVRGYKDTLIEALRSFRCFKDEDVQNFLNTKAISFESRGWATTYIFLNAERLKAGELFIEGYFSLSHKAVIFSNSVSGASKSKIAGTKMSETASFVLIGQLGKYMDTSSSPAFKSELSSENILTEAMNIIRCSSDYIVCRNVLIECKPIEKIQKIYSDFGFKELQYEDGLHSMYLRMDVPVDFNI